MVRSVSKPVKASPAKCSLGSLSCVLIVLRMYSEAETRSPPCTGRSQMVSSGVGLNNSTIISRMCLGAELPILPGVDSFTQHILI